jgi:hypothetical protein
MFSKKEKEKHGASHHSSSEFHGQNRRGKPLFHANYLVNGGYSWHTLFLAVDR